LQLSIQENECLLAMFTRIEQETVSAANEINELSVYTNDGEI
jgi:hypothetical protein